MSAASAATLARLFAELCLRYDIDPDALAGRGRARMQVDRRWQIAWELRQAGAKLRQIGVLLGRDYSTVIHGLRQVEKGSEAAFKAAWLRGAGGSAEG